MRISDRSSDVCSSDLLSPRLRSGSSGDARETAAQHRVRQPRLHRAGLFLRRTTERARTGNASSQQGERSMTMRHVTIFGASSRQGQEQVGAALTEEHAVRAITRNAEIFADRTDARLEERKSTSPNSSH